MRAFETLKETAETFARPIIFLVGLALCYGLVAFIYYDPNPANWGFFGRILMGIVSVVFSVLYSQAVSSSDDEK